MLTDRKPFDNNDVRVALKYGIDREHVLRQILQGFGTLGNDHPIGPNQKYYASELAQRRYDPDMARFHMKKAGMLDYPFKLHAAEMAFKGAVDTAVLFKAHAAKAGIKIDVVKEPDDGYWDKVWMKKPWVMCYWGGRATADLMFSTTYAANVPWNDTHWNHERFNKLLTEARAELNEKRRQELYVECQRIVRDEGGVVIPVFANWISAANHKLRFVNPSGVWDLDGARAPERWWFES
jgi:peptide/nickel transport system substrate-binding protein